VRHLRLIAAVAMLWAGLGTWSPATAGEFATKDDAVALVKQAIAHVAEVGMDTASKEFMDHNSQWIDRDLYLVVVDMKGVRQVHGQNPKLIGKSYEDAVDVNGKEYGKEVMQIANGPGSSWVSFMFKDPLTGKILPKENYVQRAGGYIFLAGVYTR